MDFTNRQRALWQYWKWVNSVRTWTSEHADGSNYTLQLVWQVRLDARVERNIFFECSCGFILCLVNVQSNFFNVTVRSNLCWIPLLRHFFFSCPSPPICLKNSNSAMPNTSAFISKLSAVFWGESGSQRRQHTFWLGFIFARLKISQVMVARSEHKVTPTSGYRICPSIVNLNSGNVLLNMPLCTHMKMQEPHCPFESYS